MYTTATVCACLCVSVCVSVCVCVCVCVCVVCKYATLGGCAVCMQYVGVNSGCTVNVLLNKLHI